MFTAKSAISENDLQVSARQVSAMRRHQRSFHWTAHQHQLVERKFRARGWATVWLAPILEFLDEQEVQWPSDCAEPGIICSQECMVGAIGCSVSTLQKVLGRLDVLDVIVSVPRYYPGPDGKPHRTVNQYIPRRVVADAPRPYDMRAVLETSAARNKARKSRWMRPQHRRNPIGVNFEAVEGRLLLGKEKTRNNECGTLSFSGLQLDLLDVQDAVSREFRKAGRPADWIGIENEVARRLARQEGFRG